MKENHKKTKMAVGAFLASTGLACVSSLMGGKIIEGVLGGIAGNLASSYIEKIEYKKVKNLLLGGPQPEELNHDLKKILERAIIWSMENIEMLYKEEISEPEQISTLKETIKLAKQDITLHFQHLYLEEDQIIKHVDESTDFQSMANDLDVVYQTLPTIATENPFPDFFKLHFPNQLQLCFGELLKKEENRPAWIAYQRFMFQSSQRYFKTLKAQNEAILFELKKPKLAQPLLLDLKTIESQFNQYSFEHLQPQMQTSLNHYTLGLKSDLAAISKKLDEGIELSEQIGKDTHQTKEMVKDINRTLKKDWMPKRKVLLFTGLGILTLALLTFWYSTMSSDFNLNAYINASSDLKISSDYPSPDYPIEFKISTPDRILNEAVYENKKLISNPISGKWANAKVKITMDDPYWRLVEDSLILNKALTEILIEPNDALAKIKGMVRGLNNQFLANAKVQIGTDTTLVTDELGKIDATLPISMRKEMHQIIISAPAYQASSIEYYPNASEFAIRLEALNH